MLRCLIESSWPTSFLFEICWFEFGSPFLCFVSFVICPSSSMIMIIDDVNVMMILIMMLMLMTTVMIMTGLQLSLNRRHDC